jgi:hypothetical protein
MASTGAPPGGKLKPRRAVLARGAAAPVLALDGAPCATLLAPRPVSAATHCASLAAQSRNALALLQRSRLAVASLQKGAPLLRTRADFWHAPRQRCRTRRAWRESCLATRRGATRRR